jgi:hypothetical protein
VEAVYARAVTAHPYSQRAEHSRGYRESALMLGSVPQGKDESGQSTPRAASLLTFLPLDLSPRPVSFPERYSASLQAAYANLELETVAPEREQALEQLGDRPSAAIERDEQRRSSVITVSRWGEEGRSQMVDAVRSAVHHHELPSDDPVPHRPGPDDAEAGWAVEREPLHSLKFFLFFWRKKKGERDRRRRGEKGKRAARIFSLSLFFSSYLARTSISQEKSKRPMISREEDIGAFVERDRAKRRKERKKLTCPPFFRSREEVEKKMKRANRGTANRGTANR